MKIFLDTANVEHIKEANSWGIIDGVTTNPTLIAREGRDFREVVEEICNIVDGPISAEVVSMKSEEMVEEAKELAKIHKNIVNHWQVFCTCRTGNRSPAPRRRYRRPVRRCPGRCGGKARS